MEKSVALMARRQATESSAGEARALADELDRIGARAGTEMAAKVDALSQSLRDFAGWVDRPIGGFSGEDYAVAGLELGNTCGLDLPIGPASSGGMSPGNRGPAEGEVVHLTYFDVTVNSHVRQGQSLGVNVTVCYVRPHPDANPDGTTRVSTDPWSFILANTRSGPRAVPVSSANESTAWSPQYGEDFLRVGRCQTGWIGVAAPSGERFIGMTYAPRDFPADVTTWEWE